MKDFFEELRRRHIFRVALTYLVVAWLLIQVINNIAAPLGLPAWAPTLVIVLLGLGFPVALVIAWAFDPPQKAAAAEDGVRKPPVPPLARKWDFVIIGLLVVALGYFVWENQNGRQGAQAPESAVAEASVAVLPFSDISPAGDQEYFADGVSEEILNSLARIDGLQVAARTSSFYFKGRDTDIGTIGEKLGVAHVLEGSVRKAGDQVRITAQLINAETGYHLWSQTYDRQLEDIFAVQGDIAESVARALEITLGVGDLGLQPGMTRDVAAYDAFLEGRRPEQEGESTVEVYRQQIEALERAVELDPSFAVAWAGLASVYESIWGFDEPANAAEWRRKAEAARARARKLAPEAPLVLLQSAGAAANRQDWTEADRLYRRALELHGDAARTGNFGWFLLGMGKAEAAIDDLTAARRIDPLSPGIAFSLGKAHAAAGDMQEALADFERAETLGASLEQARGAALIVALAMGDRAEIERCLELATAGTSGIGADVNTLMRERLDDPEAALAELRRLREETDDLSAIGQIVLAQWAAYFGDPELALTIVEEALPPGIEASVGAMTVLWDPIVAEMRALPGFKDYVREAGLVDYWRETGWGDFCRPVGEKDFECE